MSITDTMTQIAIGRGHPNLLGACRLEVGGFDAFGIEAINDAFRRNPMTFDPAVVMEAPMHFAVISDGQALFADVYDGNIGRLWRAGAHAPFSTEPFISVAFDPDLKQARGDILFSGQDHPALTPDGYDRVQSAGLDLLASDPMAWRSRGFCIRAFGKYESGAALFAIHTMQSDRVRISGFAYGIAVWRGEAIDLAIDTIASDATTGLIRIAA
jgi:hypothetical protein